MSRPECLDCGLFQCDTCADNNYDWLNGGCCCGRILPEPYGDDEWGMELIAHAADDIAYLLAERRRMEAEIARHRDALAGLYIAPDSRGTHTVDALLEAAQIEVAEDRRIAALMKQAKNSAVLEQRARVTEELAAALARIRDAFAGWTWRADKDGDVWIERGNLLIHVGGHDMITQALIRILPERDHA